MGLKGQCMAAFLVVSKPNLLILGESAHFATQYSFPS